MCKNTFDDNIVQRVVQVQLSLVGITSECSLMMRLLLVLFYLIQGYKFSLE